MSDDREHTDSSALTPDHAPALCNDGRRALIAIAASLIVPFGLSWILDATMPELDGPATTVVLLLVGWDVFVVVYLVLTARTFNRVPSDEFRLRIAAARSASPSSAGRRHCDHHPPR